MGRDRKNTAIFVAYEESPEPDSAVPEKNLLRAILLNAMNDLHKDGVFAKKAMEYFLSPEEDYLFSFRSICSYLDIDARRVLKITGLLNLKEPARANMYRGDQNQRRSA